MTIYEEIQVAQKNARLNKDKATLLIFSTVLGNMAAGAKLVDGEKTVSDQDAIAYLKKHVKGLDETLGFTTDQEAQADLNAEKALLIPYLPTQLTDDEVYVTLSGRKATGELNSLSEAMQWLKAELPGLYDGKTASIIAKKLFS